MFERSPFRPMVVAWRPEAWTASCTFGRTSTCPAAELHASLQGRLGEVQSRSFAPHKPFLITGSAAVRDGHLWRWNYDESDDKKTRNILPGEPYGVDCAVALVRTASGWPPVPAASSSFGTNLAAVSSTNLRLEVTAPPSRLWPSAPMASVLARLRRRHNSALGIRVVQDIAKSRLRRPLRFHHFD